MWIEIIISHSITIEAPLMLKVVDVDPDDNKFIECAVLGYADYIISGDKHLLDLKEYEQIKILSPAQFCAEHSLLF